jgi:hypothetical protein
MFVVPLFDFRRRRDTFTVPKLGWAVVSVVADNVGYWACAYFPLLYPAEIIC